jgi:hypothetical protein
MSGFYDDASWVLIPEGIKEDVVYAQKPTDGLGDLAFTRASDATRTNSAGVVERTPWNLVQQSVWTGGGSNVAPTGWTSFLSSGNFAPSTTTNGNVSYRFFATSGRSFLRQSITVVAGQQLRVSAFVESITTATTISDVLIFDGVSFSGAKFYIDNTEVANSTVITAGKRIAYSATSTAAGTASARIGGGQSGATTYDFVLSQPQVVEGTDAKPYFATTNRQDVPRLDYRNADGTLNSCPRLLLEPQRTNSIRNSTMVGAVAGSPGTLPTNWTSTLSGLTQTIIGAGTENGIQYVDIRFNGTATVNFGLLRHEALGQIAALNGQNWSYSFYFKAISQPAPPTAYRQVIYERTAPGSLVTSSTFAFTPTSNLQRFLASATLSGGATVGSVDPVFLWQMVVGQTYDFTIRIAAPQMELGATASTFIPTTTAAVTRIADDASKLGVSSLIGQTQGTLFFEYSMSNWEASSRLFGISDGSSTNRIIVILNTNHRFRFLVTVGSVAQVDFSTNSFTNGVFKIAFAYAENDFAVYINGVQVGTDNSGTIPACSNIYVGKIETIAATFHIGNPLAQAALFPTRLTNAQLAEITTL